MGKSQPQAPAAPDPNVVSAAQTKSNQQTALYQSQLNNGNSYGPNGSVTNTYNPTTNQWTQNTTLSPQQQAIYNQGTAAEAGALGIANNQLGAVQNALNTQMQGYAPATGVQGGPIQSGYGNGGQVAYGYAQGQPVQGQVGNTPVQYGFNQGQPVQGQVGSGAPIQFGYGNGGPIQQGVQTNGLQSGYNQGGAIQGQVAGSGQIATGYGNGGQIQNGYASGGPIQSGYGNGGPIQSNIGSADINQAVQNAGNAAYGQATSRLDPQWQQAAEQQQAQLVAQGLNPNSDAYKNSMTLFNNARNDAYNQANFSAVAAGNQEQNTLFGQQQAQGQFFNAAQAQANAQNQGAAQFANQAQQQANTQNAAQAAFGNAAQSQANTQNAAAAAFGNTAQGQLYGENLQSGQFANAAQAQANSQNAAQAGFYNQSQLSGFGEGLQAGQFANAAQGQANSQNAQALAAYNAAQGQQFGQGVTQGQFANQAAGQQFSQGLQGQQAYNQAAGQEFNQGLQQGNFANTAAAQQYAQSAGNAQFNNAAQAQANAQNQALAAFGNTAQQQAFGQGQSNAQLWNSGNQQAFQNNAYMQQLPINELTALLSSGQVSMPGGYTGSATSVAPTDVLGAYGLQQSVLNAQYQAQMQNYQSSMGGLFNLGSAAMSLLPFSDVRLKRDIAPAGQWRGHNVYSFRYLWDRDEDPPHVGVIAQEIAQTHPHALGQRDGFLTVNYAAL